MEGENSVQPGGTESGQGESSSGVGQFFDLSNVPEDYVPHIEPLLAEVQKNVNNKFQEAANYRKQWEPFEELGLNEYEPEAIKNLLEFAQMANDEGQFKDWWEKVGDELGFLDDYMSTFGDDDEDDEGDGELESNLTDDKVAEIVKAQLEGALSPLLQQQQQRQQQEELEAVNKQIDEQIAALKKEHGDIDEQTLFRFAMAYNDENAIQRGFEDYQNFVNSIKSNTIEGKINGPAQTGGEGPPNTKVEPPTGFNDAEQMAAERLRQLQAS